MDAEPLREVLSAWIQMRDLVHLQEVCNNKLKQKLSEVALAIEDEYEVCFELITTAKLTESAERLGDIPRTACGPLSKRRISSHISVGQ